jgi:hypothetical protein
MTPKEIIKIMNLFTNQNEELIIAWWEKSFITTGQSEVENEINSSNWLDLVDYSERMDWSCINSQFDNYLEDMSDE